MYICIKIQLCTTAVAFCTYYTIAIMMTRCDSSFCSRQTAR